MKPTRGNRQKRGNGDGSVWKRGTRWWMAYYDENGVRQTRSTGMTERRLAERMLQAELDRLTNIRAGVVDPAAERLSESGRRTIKDTSEAFGAHLRAQGRTERYVARTEREVRDFARDAKIETLAEVTAEKAAEYLEALRAAGQSARTRQCRITSVKGFTRWAWREGLRATDPLVGLKRPNPETDRRLRRRVLTVAEWRWLEPTTKRAPERFEMTGPARALLYAVALQTGLRSGELRTLTRSSLHLAGDEPFVVVSAGGTKNRKPARQFVLPALAARLRQHAARLSPGAPVFRLPDAWDMAAMVRADLADARREWIDAAEHAPEEAARRCESDFLTDRDREGRVIDFHALRHTCGAWAAIGGASPKAMQTLMRHSTITLTLDTYGHLLPDEAAQTVGRMPGFDDPEREAATGTADAAPDCSNNVRNPGASRREAGRDAASGRDDSNERAVLATIGQSATCGDEAQPDAIECANGPAGIRTQDQTIMSRLLSPLSYGA